jgi:DNA polymerase eta
LTIPLEQLKQKLGDDSGTWVHQIIRGVDHSEVSSRTQIKSMLSAKSFRPSINNAEQAHRWLRIFAADIYARLVDEGVVENKRRPKTMNLHHRTGGQMKSRQAPIPLGRKIDEIALFDLAKSLLSQIILEGRVWPCANLSLSVGGFEDGVSGNMGIGAFLVKGDEAKAMTSTSRESSNSDAGHERPEKRRRVEGPSGIQRFLVKAETTDEYDDDFGAQGHATVEDAALLGAASTHDNVYEHGNETEQKLPSSAVLQDAHNSTDYVCSRCGAKSESAEELQSHDDWHFAKDLQEQDRTSLSTTSTTVHTSKKTPTTINKKKTGRNKPEKGQSKLAFG